MDLTDIKEADWRQGHVLPEGLAQRIAEKDGRRGEILVLLSQDCDLQNQDIEKEPYAEAIWGRCGEDLSTRPQNSPRYVVLQVREGDGTSLAEFQVFDKVIFAREMLIGHRPEPGRSISAHERRKLIRMVVKRYDRPAFPDTFNDRLRPACSSKKKREDIRKLLEVNADVISGVYLRLQPGDVELPLEESYQLAIVMTQRVADYNKTDERNRAERAAEMIEEVIRAKCPGIDLGPEDDSSVELLSEDAATLDMLRTYIPWDWDYLSQDEGDDLPVKTT